tara:strand:- start:22263 stop:22973 length:711 start_codon:yes stop_codon:yes gene_type:complete
MQSDTPQDDENSAPKARLKAAAQKLFAERGVDGVSVRDITAAAGLRNSASLNYHFGGKEALVRELIIDGARSTDEARNRALDNMEADGGPKEIADIIRLLLDTNIGVNAGISGATQGYMQFITVLQMNNRTLFMEALENRWNSAYLRCQDYLRNFLSDLPPEVLNHRLVFMTLFINMALSSRETALENTHRTGKLWTQTGSLEQMTDCIVGMLTAPQSAMEEGQLRKAKIQSYITQ